jgi:hypothetical protein
MSDDLARLLYEGAVAVRQGRHSEAQRLLMRVIELDEQNEEAWLWLSGAVDDPSDQQIALENVLALNPGNQYAQEGLRWLQRNASGAVQAPAVGSDWQPPPPLNEDEVVELHCWSCGASLYSVAEYCWQCHSPIHSCNNCTFRHESRCKELQGLTTDLLQTGRNECPWWRPTG